jgi:hypothetical protein
MYWKALLLVLFRPRFLPLQVRGEGRAITL